MTQSIICAMCGQRFNPKEHSACEACPLQSGCQLVCCPACGYETINIQESKLARFFARLLPGTKESERPPGMTLADAPPGCWVKIINFSTSVPIEKQAHLQAYGLVDGYPVRVVQHSPVTVVQVEHTEIAMEKSLALELQVEELKES